MADLMNCYLIHRKLRNLFRIKPQIILFHYTSDDSFDHAYFEKADPTASIGSSKMFVVIEVYITQEPGVGKFLTSAIKSLIATQMPSCEKYSGTEGKKMMHSFLSQFDKTLCIFCKYLTE